MSAAAGQTVAAGSFSYTNTSRAGEQITTVTVDVSSPATLTALTLSVAASGASSTVSPVAATNLFTLDSPVTIGAGATVQFSLSAQGASGSARIERPVAYAAMIGGGLPPGPAGDTSILLMVMSLIALPLARPRRRLTLVFALFIVLLAGCGGGSSSSTAGNTDPAVKVNSDGTLSKPVSLSTVTAPTGSTIQQLTQVSFN